MNLLVIGAKGQLGMALQKLLEAKHNTAGTVPQRFLNANIYPVDRSIYNLADPRIAQGLIQKTKADIVINCAAYTNVDGCETNPSLALSSNALLPHSLAQSCEAQGIDFMQISTDYVFSGIADKPYSEYDIPAPKNIYGSTKLLGEQYVMQDCKKTFVVRTAWLYGDSPNNFVSKILNSAKSNRFLQVVEDQIGSPTYVDDLAYYLLRILANGYYGLYHCVNSGACSRYELAQEILKTAKIPCKVIPCKTVDYPVIAQRPQNTSLNNEMLKVIGEKEPRPWQEALASCLLRLK